MSIKNVFSKNIINGISRRTHSVVTASKKNLWSAGNIMSSPFEDVKIPNTTVVNYIWEKIDRWPNKTAVICAITNRSYTYQQLYKYSRNLAARLRSLFQIRDGDLICTMMPNNPQYCIAVLGGLEAGAELTTMNPIYTAYEAHKQLLLSTPKVIFGTTDTVKVIKDALSLAKLDVPIIVVKANGSDLPQGTVDLEEIAYGDNVDVSILKEVRREPEDIALLPYSSGTTGLPKGVELRNRNLIANFVQTDAFSCFRESKGSCQETVISVLPFYHIYGLSVIMLHLFSLGAKLVTLPNFKPYTFLNALKDHRISILPAVPPMVSFLGNHPDSKKEHLDYIQTIICGAAPLPKSDIEKLFEKTIPTVNFSQVYGLTESSALVAMGPLSSDNNNMALFPLPNMELKIVGKDQRVLGPDQVGELLLRGPQMMKGYRNNVEANKNAFDQDGWFRSGDLVSLSEDGSLTIHDRLKELIKVKGYQVAPAELESVLKEHPDILDAAVIGVPDPRMGEVPKAFVVTKNDQKKDSKDIMKFVSKKVAGYKRLKEVVFVDNIPRNPSGKILRRLFRNQV